VEGLVVEIFVLVVVVVVVVVVVEVVVVVAVVVVVVVVVVVSFVLRITVLICASRNIFLVLVFEQNITSYT
jgi:hypothetical protein